MSRFLALLLLASACRAAEPKVDDATARLDAQLWKASLTMQAGGVVVAIVHGSDVAYGYYGSPSAAKEVALENAIFDIGSITKTFTSLLLAQAVIEHRVKLDDPLSKLLPAETHLSPSAGAITLRQLASHTSGLPKLPDNLKIQDMRDPYAYYTAAELETYLSTYQAAGPLPAPFRYSNLGMGLVGRVLESVYGKSYNDLIAEKVAGPLHLKDTTVDLTADQEDRLVVPHLRGQPTNHWHSPILGGAGALHSTLADLVLFAQTMNQGGGPLAAAWAMIREKESSDPVTKFDCGLGVMRGSEQGELTYWHNGSTISMVSYLEWTPSTGRAYVILANTDEIDPTRLARKALWTKEKVPTTPAE